jgi:hypothetical protein
MAEPHRPGERYRRNFLIEGGKIPFIRRIFARDLAMEMTMLGFSNYSQRAGEEWRDKEFYENQFILLSGVLGSTANCVGAGENWNDERFAAHAYTLVDAITQDPESAADALNKWNDDRVELFKDEFARSVLQSSKASYDAIRTDRPALLGEHRNAIASKAFSEPEWCYKLGKNFKSAVDAVYPEFADKIAMGLSRSAEYSFKARRDWTGLENNLSLQVYPKVGFDFDNFVLHFPEDSYGTLIAQIPEATWKKLLEVESLSTEEFKEGLFYSNLPAVLDSGNVERWANTILEHFKEVAIGGDTYRIA